MRCIRFSKEWFLTWGWIILFILGVIGIVAYTNSYASLILNLSVCLVTSAIFYFIVTFLPYHFMKKQKGKVIRVEFYRLNETLRLCRNSIYSPFDFAVKPDEKKEEDYIRDFEQTNFNECWVQSKTKYERFEEKRLQAKNIAEHLSAEQTLSLKQQEIISDLLSSVFANEELRPIPYDLPERDRISYPSNQEEMGKCVLRFYKLTHM